MKIPCGKAICGHRWEGRTSALSSNNINRDISDTVELHMVGIKLMIHRCQLFRSGFLHVWSMDDVIEIVRVCLLKLQMPGPTLGLRNQNQVGGVEGAYI